MKFSLIKSEQKGTEIPQTVFDNLHDAHGNDLKVILYVIKTQNADPLKISSDLDISHSSANSALLYWADKGLVLCEEEEEKAKKKKPQLTSEIVATLSSDPGVRALVQKLQLIFGGAINEKYTNRFLALYLEESIPVDVILQIVQHHISIGINNPAYIIKVVRSWHTKLGLDSGGAVDEYLALCEKREKVYNTVCRIFGISADKLKSSEKKLIDRWKEKFDMSDEMIAESFVRAGNQASIPYCNGIIKSWAQKGYKTPKELDSVITNITESRRNIDSHGEETAKPVRRVPTLDD
ncbi:MAG: DnaD domain protein [Oscillospiraceae bacterium]|nr:DnaD domain protein [Oscillospiraceae bacterium]